MKIIVALLTLAVATTFSGCATRAFTAPYSDVVANADPKLGPMPSVEQERAKFLGFDKRNHDRLQALIQQRTTERAGQEDSYRLGAQDTVEVNVFDVPELNLSAQVSEAGFISLPLIGAVQAAGKTQGEVLANLRDRIGAFVRNPQVSLAVTQFGSQKVSVLGAVTTPGSYPLRKGTNTLAEILGQAGGINQRAGNYINFVPAEFSGLGTSSDPSARARLSPSSSGAEGGERAGIEIYVDDLLGTGGAIPIEVPVRAGDMIIVPESGKVMVEGEVQKVGSYDLGQQMTMLGALAAAGGITFGAKMDEVEIIREISPTEKARLIVDLTKVASGEQKDVRLRNSDIVRVPSDSQRRFRQDTYELVGRVINFGVGGSVNVLP